MTLQTTLCFMDTSIIIHIAFAAVAVVLAILFIWATNQMLESNGLFGILGTALGLYALYCGGFPTLLAFALFAKIVKLVLPKNFKLSDSSQMLLINIGVFIQFIIWSQLFALLINYLNTEAEPTYIQI